MLCWLAFNVQVRIDHHNQSVTFGNDVSLVEQSIEGQLLQVNPLDVCWLLPIIHCTALPHGF